jgi:putative ABC transport system permease protein
MLLKLLFRNAFRHRLRTLLTIGGIAVAILAFGLLRTVISAWYAGVEASSASRLVTRNAISLIFPLPLSYKDKIRSVEGVNVVSYGNWFGGIYIEEKNFFANFAIEPKSYFALYSEFLLSGDETAAFFRERKACVAGKKLARRFDWKVGDTITLRGTIFPGNWDFVLRGIYQGKDKTIDENQFFFHWDYLNETLKKVLPRRADQVGFYMIGLKRPDQAAETSEAVDGLFKNSYAETLTETEKAFQMSFVTMSEAIITVIQLVSYVIIVIIMAVVANTMAMSVRERMCEYAVFKTLGFGRGFLAALILGESLTLTTIGGMLGIGVTFPAARAFAQAVGQFFPIFHVSAETVLMDLAAAATVGVVAAVIPIWRVVQVRIADGLGRIG